MGLATLLALAALGGSGTLLVNGRARVPAILAVVVSGVMVATALGWMQLSVAGVALPLVLGIALVVVGVFMWARVSAKALVAAATVVSMAGALTALTALGI